MHSGAKRVDERGYRQGNEVCAGADMLCTTVCCTHTDARDVTIGSIGENAMSPALPIGVGIDPKTGDYRQLVLATCSTPLCAATHAMACGYVGGGGGGTL